MVYFRTYAHPSYCPSDLLARGFTAARWTSGRSARPPCPSRGARPPSPPIAAALGPEIVLT